MKNQVTKTQKENGKFTYSVNGKVFIKESKKDYNYMLVGVGSLSKSLKGIESQYSFWLKYGSHSEEEKAAWEICTIELI